RQNHAHFPLIATARPAKNRANSSVGDLLDIANRIVGPENTEFASAAAPRRVQVSAGSVLQSHRRSLLVSSAAPAATPISSRATHSPESAGAADYFGISQRSSCRRSSASGATVRRRASAVSAPVPAA